MNFIRFLLGIRKSEQELYEESLEEARDLVSSWERSQPIAKSARKRIPQIVRGLQLDGIQADADLIHRLAVIAADGYVESHQYGCVHNHVDEDMVRGMFDAEYAEAYEEGMFSYLLEERHFEE